MTPHSFALSGASRSGKTTLINTWKNNGHHTIIEGIESIAAAQFKGVHISQLNLQNRIRFQHALLRFKYTEHRSMRDRAFVISDRSFIDLAARHIIYCSSDPELRRFVEICAALSRRYIRTVFLFSAADILPPWKSDPDFIMRQSHFVDMCIALARDWGIERKKGCDFSPNPP